MLHFRDKSGQGGQFLDRHLLFDADIFQYLRQALHAAAQLGNLGLFGNHDLKDVQCRQDPVAGRRTVAEDQVTRLLAAEVVVAAQHFFHDVTVANSGAFELCADALEGDLEAHIAHDGTDDRVFAQFALTHHLDGTDRQDFVAVDDLASVIDDHQAVGVTVEGNADVGFVEFDLIGKLLRVESPANPR